MTLSGHFWTIAPNLRHRIFPLASPPSVEWITAVDDAKLGPIQLSGRLQPGSDSSVALIVVHGLGGSHERHYCIRAAQEAQERGWMCLRLALRGADRRGQDFYHAGLTTDIESALAAPELQSVDHIAVVGYSLGGHVVLRLAASNPDARLRAVVAVCPPLDLSSAASWLDEHTPTVYRRHVLTGLTQIYAAVAARREVPTPMARIKQVEAIREWDELTVVPRYGFDDVAHYYRTQSAGACLSGVKLPTLVVCSRNDPMLNWKDVERDLAEAPNCVTVRSTDRGGHVGFPPYLDLGLGDRRGLEPQLFQWLADQLPG